MTLDDFKQEAEIWGPDIARWPAVLQPAARALAGSPEAKAALAEAADFEARLRRACGEIADRRADDVAFRVLSRIAQGGGALRPLLGDVFLRWLMPIGGMAMSAALGVAAAHMTSQTAANHGGVVLVSQILDSGSFAADLAVR
jgi:hypothetical protein